MPAKSNQTFRLVLLCVLLIVAFVTVCRRKTTRTTYINQSAVFGDNGNLLLGNPTNAVHSTGNQDNYLIDHKYYIESYNRSRGTPNWVSWHIGAADLGSADRSDDFRPDEALPQQMTAAIRIPGSIKATTARPATVLHRRKPTMLLLL